MAACIVCGRDAGFHRLAIDLHRDETVGGLCPECERTEFGRSLKRGFFRETEGCILCARDGHIALPVGEPVATRTADGEIQSEIDHEISGVTPRLCDEHFHTLAASEPPDAPGRQVREFW